MIRIRRGEEPASLAPVRSRNLPIAEAEFHAGTLRRDHLEGYKVVRDDLWRAQHFKCCYCERNNLEPAHSDVEHFRPALKAERGAGFPTHGSWWLAWTWAHLLFARKVRNGSHKRAKFPLEPGSPVLSPGDRPPGDERQTLLDPAREDPLAHIQFRRIHVEGRVQWQPFARDGSRRGWKSVSELGLNRPALVTLYGKHVDDHVTPALNQLAAAIGRGNRAEIQEVWRADVLVLVLPGRPFTALSFDVIDCLVPLADRRRWGLSFRRPS